MPNYRLPPKDPITLTVYHGGLCEVLPEVGWLDFTTDITVAQRRADKWGVHGRILTVQLEVDRKRNYRPTDMHWHYLPNMPMQRLPHRQFVYRSGSAFEAYEAKKKMLESLGVSMVAHTNT